MLRASWGHGDVGRSGMETGGPSQALGCSGKRAAWVDMFLQRLKGRLVSAARGATSPPQRSPEAPSVGRVQHPALP